jgi:ribosome-associated translation inhibitor RaiA
MATKTLAKTRVRKGATAEMPLALRTSGIEVTPEVSEHVHERLRRRLEKLSKQVERLSVRFEDVNGPRNGRDTVCRIKVVLAGLPSIIVEELASDPLEAFNRADHRVERAVVRAVGRQRRLTRPAGVRIRVSRARATSREAHAKRPRPASEAASPPGHASRPPRRATVVLETSHGPRPSRKTTRKSANRKRASNKLSRRQTRRVTSPKARAKRAVAKRR